MQERLQGRLTDATFTGAGPFAIATLHFTTKKGRRSKTRAAGAERTGLIGLPASSTLSRRRAAPFRDDATSHEFPDPVLFLQQVFIVSSAGDHGRSAGADNVTPVDLGGCGNTVRCNVRFETMCLEARGAGGVVAAGRASRGRLKYASILAGPPFAEALPTISPPS